MATARRFDGDTASGLAYNLLREGTFLALKISEQTTFYRLPELPS